MAQEIINPIQNISYTSKDFETVYPEILNLVKTLTYKWDPSISNESDPGVILIKLLAILEDKCNYNIDKNILEAFPLSVTQNTNARQLFGQLGYFMHWYRSAETYVTLKWIGESSDKYYTIPAFTMVSDEDSTVVYTLVGPAANTSTATFNVGAQKLRATGDEISFKAIQGVAVNYDVLGDTLITYDFLDSNNRLYFDTIDIAQNGIFICNAGQNNYKDWVRKDNLLVESLGNCFYKFGVTNDASKCYIEFPTDAEKLFQEGINITYIKTDGANGNVAARTLSKFYNDLIPEEDTSIQLNTSTVQIYNPSAGTGGKDPEDINDAYNNYMHTVGTFDTLITLRDYINKIYETELVSNDFVCDRTNDIQSVYTIQATVNDLDQPQQIIESTVIQREDTSGNPVLLEEPMLNAYDLKLYLLQPSTDLSTLTGYQKTFRPMTDAQSANVKAVIDDIKSIQHDYQDILPNTATQSHFCYFINKYPINWTVKTQYAVSDNIWNSEILVNIKNALYENLNARQINFGEAIDPDYLYQVIMNADKRIKTVYKGNITYQTYAVYFDGTNYKEQLISEDDNNPFTDEVTYTTTNSGLSASIVYATWVTQVPAYTYVSLPLVYDGTDWTLAGTAVTPATYGITITGTPTTGDTMTFRNSLKNQFRDEVYTKSVLAGKTQFFVKDELFDYQLNQSMTTVTGEIGEIGGDFIGQHTDLAPTYNLRENETIRLYAPNLIDDTVYSDYVRFSFYSATSKTIQANESFELGANQFLTFYWRESTDSLYSYACYGTGNIICPTFAITSSQTDTFPTTLQLVDLEQGNSTHPRYGLSGTCSVAQSEIVAAWGSVQVLSGNKSATVRKVNQINLTKSTGYYCYWITDKYRTDINDVKHYILFSEGEDEKILNYNEYFIYANSTLTNMVILGAGSKITRNTTTGEWSVIALDSSSILEKGASFLTDNDAWFKLTGTNEMYLIENQFIAINPGFKLKLTPKWTDTTYTNWVGQFHKTGFYSFRYSASGTLTINGWNTKKLSIVGLNAHTFAYNGTIWTLDTSTTVGDSAALKAGYGIDVSNAASGASIVVYSVKLGDFEIEYTDLLNQTTAVSSIASTAGSWDGYSILNVYIDTADEMILRSNQFIRYIVAGDETRSEVVIAGADPIETSTICTYPVVLLSSLSIKNNTTSIIPCYTVDESGVVYPKLYQFKRYYNAIDNLNGVTYTSDGTVLLTFQHSATETTIEKTINFKVPEGKYILALVNNYVEDVSNLKVWLDNVAVHPMWSSTVVDFSAQNIYYLYLPITTSANDHVLKVSMDNPDETKNITLYNPYKYKKPVRQIRPFNADDGIMSDAEFAKYEELIKIFDINHIFNYTYEVASDIEISRPNEAEEFNNSNHVFNQFTICEISEIGKLR